MDAAARTWVGLMAGALVVDGVLVFTERRSLTACAQAHPMLTGAGFVLLAGHFHRRFGRYDPFDRAAMLVARRAKRAAHLTSA